MPRDARSRVGAGGETCSASSSHASQPRRNTGCAAVLEAGVAGWGLGAMQA
jgi:hypothetical protein